MKILYLEYSKARENKTYQGHNELSFHGFGLCSEVKETLNETPMKKEMFLWQNNPYLTYF